MSVIRRVAPVSLRARKLDELRAAPSDCLKTTD